MTPAQAQYAPLLVLFGIFILRVARGGGRVRDVRIERLWIIPAVFAALMIAMLSMQHVDWSPALVAVFVVALALGGGAGWIRGRTTAITIVPETHVLKSQNSAAGLLVVMGFLLLRMLVRDYSLQHATQWHVSPTSIVEAFMMFALGAIVGRRVEILLRCQRLLAQARAASTAGGVMPSELSEERA